MIFHFSDFSIRFGVLAVIKIRRLIDRRRAYTGIFLPGQPPRIFPTSEQEHSRIMEIYKQEKPHAGIINDFSEYRLGLDTPTPSQRSK